MQKRINIAGIRLGILLTYALPALAQLQTLTYRPVDSIYSTQLDRLIMVNANPSQLHIYNPITRADSAVALQYPPTAVSLSLDGLYAAVGHDQWISWVDLRNASVVRTINIGIDVARLAVANGYVYGFSRTNGSTRVAIRYVPVSGGSSSAGPTLAAQHLGFQPRPVVVRDGASIYASDDYSTARLDTGPAGALTRVLLPNQPRFSQVFPMGADQLLTASDGIVVSTQAVASEDLVYRGAVGVFSLLAAAWSGTRGEVAMVTPNSIGEPTAQSEVRIHQTDYRSVRGRLTVPPFVTPAKTAAGLVLEVFYSSDSTRLIVVQQADPAAALAVDFGVSIFEMGSSCPVTWSPGSAVVDGRGGRGTVTVGTSGSCLWQASTSAPWLILTQGSTGTNQSSLSWYAEPNPAASARSANIVIGNQTFTVMQTGAGARELVTILPFRPLDSQYSKPLDRLVLVGFDPDQLHVYDPVSRTETRTINLPAAPVAFGISPDGLAAAVALDGDVLVVNLLTGATERRFSIPFRPSGVVLGPAWLYVFDPYGPAPGNFLAIELATGLKKPSGSARWTPRSGWLSVDGKYLFTTGNYSSAYTQRWRLDGGLPVSPVSNSISSGEILWPAADGRRLFTAFGSVLGLSDVPAQDLVSIGSLDARPRSVAQIPSRGYVFGLPFATEFGKPGSPFEIRRYSDDTLAFQGATPLPRMASPSGLLVAATGESIFASAAEDQLHLVVASLGSAADLRSNRGIYSLAVPGAGPSACEFSVGSSSVTLPQAGTPGATITVTATPGCTWTITSGANWFYTSASQRVGTGTVSVIGLANMGNAPRTDTITIAGKTLSVVQPGVNACALRLPEEVVVPAAATSAALVAEGTAGCTFPITAPGGTFLGAGFSTVIPVNTRYLISLAANTTGVARSANVSVGGGQVKITQLADGGCTPNLTLPAPVPEAGGTASATLTFTGSCPATWSIAGAPAWTSVFPGQGATNSPQSLTWTVYPNFSSQIRTGLLRFAGMPAVSITQSASTASADSRFVSRAYFAALGRSPSPAEIDFQIANALNKGVSRADLALSFLTAPEFNLASRYVAGLYVGLLARDAEFAGWTFQRNALATGAFSPLPLTGNFLSSLEFQLKYGTLSNLEFARLMYRNILLREAAPAEASLQAGALDSGTPRVNLANSFLNSAEFQQGTGPRLTAFLLYATLLSRDPLASEQATMMTRISAGTPLKTLIQEILDTYEFAAQIN